jgi:hypothetical protein
MSFFGRVRRFSTSKTPDLVQKVFLEELANLSTKVIIVLYL